MENDIETGNTQWLRLVFRDAGFRGGSRSARTEYVRKYCDIV